MCAVLAALVILAFWPVTASGFTNYDDDDYVTRNPWVRQGLSAAGWSWAWTTTHAANWHPLTWLSHMLDWELYGEAAWGHHATNLALHVLNTLLTFALLRTATGSTVRSATVAALFGVHPLHVESVAWIAERKDVLSTAFALGASLVWVRYTRSGRARWGAMAVVLLAASLASKPMFVTLPFVLLLLDYWPLERWLGARAWPALWPLLREKLPMVLLAVGSSAVTVFAQAAGGTVRTLEEVPWTARLANVPVAYATYLFKLLWPTDLAVLYPYRLSGPSPWIVLASIALLATLSAIAVGCRGRQPYLFVGWLWFLGTLVPVIGLLQVGPQALADRYTYFPSIGPFIATVWFGRSLLLRTRSAVAPAAAGIVAVILVSALVIGTRAQLRHWETSEALFTRALRVSGSHPLIHNNLGVAYFEAGRVEAAIVQYRAALQSGPSYEAYANLGAALLLRGEPEAALEALGQALQLEPDQPDALNDTGVALAAVGRYAEAIETYRRALARAPSRAVVHANLGESLAALNRRPEAVQSYQLSLELDPHQPRVLNNLGAILIEAGQVEQALALFDRALSLSPGYGEAHSNRAAALYLRGAHEEAIRELERARALGFEPPQRLVTLLGGEPPPD